MGTSERRMRERQRKEEEIIDAARTLFFSNGFDSTSMDDIATKVEISKGAIYLLFSTKEELYYAIAKEGMAIVRELFQKAAASKGNGLERLEAIGKAYVRFWTTQPEYRRLMNETVRANPPMESGRHGEAFATIAAECNEIMVRTIVEGIKDGSIRHDVDPVKFAFCSSSMIDGILARTEGKGWARPHDEWREQMLTYATDLWKRAVTPQKQT